MEDGNVIPENRIGRDADLLSLLGIQGDQESLQFSGERVGGAPKAASGGGSFGMVKSERESRGRN